VGRELTRRDALKQMHGIPWYTKSTVAPRCGAESAVNTSHETRRTPLFCGQQIWTNFHSVDQRLPIDERTIF
jgi:hypothetical protein